MNHIIVSYLINLLLVAAFIIDRLFRLRSLKEYREAKEAQLELERANNDIRITEMHKQRYENLKLLLDEKDLEMVKSSDKERILDLLLIQLNQMDRAELSDGVKRVMLLAQLKA